MRSLDHYCRGKAQSITYSKRVFVVIAIQRACPTRVSEECYWKKCVFLFFYKFCLKKFSLWGESREVLSYRHIGILVKYTLFLSDFNETWTCSTDFQKYSTIKFRDTRNKGAELFHADGWPDITKLLVAFRNFSNAPKNHKSQLCIHLMEWRFYRLSASWILSNIASSLELENLSTGVE